MTKDCPICGGVGMVRMLDIENPWEACPRCNEQTGVDMQDESDQPHKWIMFLLGCALGIIGSAFARIIFGNSELVAK